MVTQRLLARAPAQAYLLVAVALEDAPAEVAAAELNIAPAQVMRELQGALAALARQYEQVAFAGARDSRVTSAATTTTRQAGPT
jgi:DNA-directed RNA polymerase specialized sigma24 family protein